ncbi:MULTISPECIES: transglutaminase-like domain-containing protein [unclassified Afipia]|uniref:transglutaminase-like domain-containing protein n=1 Tax=unclassified Afipia TaxID=2642050 RepID=UPI0004641A79|nr:MULTISPECIES: transglutaminase-like domain-containing protein [unclassified Afipia]
MTQDLNVLLSPAEYVDSDHGDVVAFARDVTKGKGTVSDQLRALYFAVRDEIRYDPYVDFTSSETFRASSVLSARAGYCVGKAALYAALARSIGVPCRIGFADVQNHLATERLLSIMGTNVFAWHGYVECHVRDKWIKASPTFNNTLCAKLGVAPLDFDGVNDALLQSFDERDVRFMEYHVQRGVYFDVPARFLMQEMRRLYPALCVPGGAQGSRMEQEAPSR